MNKKIVTLIFLSLATIAFGQEPILNASKMLELQSANMSLGSAGISADMKAYNRVYLNSENNKWEISYDDIEGSPFLSKMFSPVKIDGVPNTEQMRYNIHADQLEINKNDEIFVFPKTSSYTKYSIINSKEAVQNLDTKDENTGYFLELSSGKNRVYKKLKIDFDQGSKAKSGYEETKDPQFSKGTPQYYIKKADGNFIKNPKTNKDILDNYTDKSQKLNEFFKSNRIKYNNEGDLKKLVVFLDTL